MTTLTPNQAQTLHSAIEAIAPIYGVASLADGSYRVDFTPDATTQQQSDAQALVDSWTPLADPDWDGFRAVILLNTTAEAILNQSPVIASTIVSLWARMTPEALQQVAPLWNQLAERYTDPNGANQTLTQGEIDALNAIATANSIPVSLDSDGLMPVG